MNQLDNTQIRSLVEAQFSHTIRSVEESYDVLDIVIGRGEILEVIKWFRDHAILKFNFLTSLCGVHFPEKKNQELCVVYHLHNMIQNKRIRVHVFLDQDDVNIPTVTNLYASANWMERETFEFYGINFTGHPDLRIILNVEDMSYHPLLKQYTLNDDTRTDKEDKYFGR